MIFSQLESGLIIPEHVARFKNEKPTVVDFFAGAGGFSLGFMQAGWTVLGAVEWDPAATLTYMVNLGSYPITIHYIDGEEGKKKLNDACKRYIFGNGKKAKSGLYDDVYGSRFSGSGWIRNHPEVEPVRHFWFGDIRKLKGEDILQALDLRKGELDCVIGGPPCQGFSKAGKQLIADPRNNLVYEFARMIVELQPKTFVMEEVPEIASFMDPDGVPVLDKFCRILDDGGYGRYDMLKKTLEMQTGCAFGMRGYSGNVNPLWSRSKRNLAKDTKEKVEESAQLTLF